MKIQLRIVLFTISLFLSFGWAFFPLLPIPDTGNDISIIVGWLFLTFPILTISIVFRKISLSEGSEYKYSYFDYIVWLFFLIAEYIMRNAEWVISQTIYYVFITVLIIANIAQIAIGFYFAKRNIMLAIRAKIDEE